MHKTLAAALALIVLGCAGPAQPQSRNLAPGFASLPKGAKVALMPTDIELFSISAGGVFEPKADWTEAASKHFRDALMQKNQTLGLSATELAQKDADEADEINALHGASPAPSRCITSATSSCRRRTASSTGRWVNRCSRSSRPPAPTTRCSALCATAM